MLMANCLLDYGGPREERMPCCIGGRRDGVGEADAAPTFDNTPKFGSTAPMRDSNVATTLIKTVLILDLWATNGAMGVPKA